MNNNKFYYILYTISFGVFLLRVLLGNRGANFSQICLKLGLLEGSCWKHISITSKYIGYWFLSGKVGCNFSVIIFTDAITGVNSGYGS